MRAVRAPTEIPGQPLNSGTSHAPNGSSMMAVIHPTTEFARAARLRTTRLRYRKALAFALFLLSLFGARAFADEKSFALSSFAPLKSQTALGFYFATYEAARLNALSTSTN